MLCGEYNLHTENLDLNTIVIYRIFNWNFFFYTERSHWLLRGHMASNTITVSCRKSLSHNIKGALSRGFRRFMVLTVLKSVVGNFTYEKHYF